MVQTVLSNQQHVRNVLLGIILIKKDLQYVKYVKREPFHNFKGMGQQDVLNVLHTLIPILVQIRVLRARILMIPCGFEEPTERVN